MNQPTTECAECNELKRSLIVITSDYRFLLDRTRSRNPSAPERRRLTRLKADGYIARQLLQNHQAICEEKT